MAQYFNIVKDLSRGYEHQIHNAQFHDPDMRKKGWLAQHSFKGFANLIAAFLGVPGVGGGLGCYSRFLKKWSNVVPTFFFNKQEYES